MKRTLLKNLSLYKRNFVGRPPALLRPIPNNVAAPSPIPSLSSLRFFSSSGNDDSASKEASLTEIDKKSLVEDVSNKELKSRIEKYFKGDEEALPDIMEAILRRNLAGKHEDTDDELMDELSFQPLKDVNEKDFDSDFEEAHETDEEISNLCNAEDIVTKRRESNEFFHMDERKWEEMIKEATEKGFLKDTRECEEILEDMLNWKKLLPDDMKKKVEVKFNELGDICERGEMKPEEAYEEFKKFEDELISEYQKKLEADGPPKFDDVTFLDNSKDTDIPEGEGAVLTWQSRLVFRPGGDAWHPKNRKVKMSVSVKELQLSKHEARRLRELVGKRYHPGRNELTITSERFEHREENRKDCLRTLYALIEEALKATKLVEDARASYVKDRLRANPAFMERLRTKVTRMNNHTTPPV